MQNKKAILLSDFGRKKNIYYNILNGTFCIYLNDNTEYAYWKFQKYNSAHLFHKSDYLFKLN